MVEEFLPDFKEVLSTFKAYVEEKEFESDELVPSLELYLDSLKFTYNMLKAVEPPMNLEIMPDLPERDIDALSEELEKKFNMLGEYNIPAEVSTNIGETEILVEYSSDDLLTIYVVICDILEVWEKQGQEVAITYCLYAFESQVITSIRNLQYYLHYAYEEEFGEDDDDFEDEEEGEIENEVK